MTTKPTMKDAQEPTSAQIREVVHEALTTVFVDADGVPRRKLVDACVNRLGCETRHVHNRIAAVLQGMDAHGLVERVPGRRGLWRANVKALEEVGPHPTARMDPTAPKAEPAKKAAKPKKAAKKAPAKKGAKKKAPAKKGGRKKAARAKPANEAQRKARAKLDAAKKAKK